jgi:hypothetical protein
MELVNGVLPMFTFYDPSYLKPGEIDLHKHVNIMLGSNTLNGYVSFGAQSQQSKEFRRFFLVVFPSWHPSSLHSRPRAVQF